MATFLVLLLLACASLSAHADISWSIDCGGSGSYTDENSIVWTGDDTIMKKGKAMLVQSSDSVKYVLSTLRVFSSGTKHCYQLKAQKGTKVLIRANFYYGNYDGKSAPPTFDIQYDGNDWATVQTDLNAQKYLYYEVIYVTKLDTISVCLIQTKPKQYPFISALEIRSLASDMYSEVDSDHSLHLMGRYAYGSEKDVRYPDDDYDRIWDATIINGADYSTVSSDASIINTNVPDRPPQPAIANAVTPSSSSETSLEVTISKFTDSPAPAYINLYFLEVSKLDPSTDKRSFHVYLDDKRLSDKPITPSYASLQEFSIFNITASKNSTISLRSTNDSTLAPLMNAMELFYVDNSTLALADTSSSLSRMETRMQLGILCLSFLFVLLFAF